MHADFNNNMLLFLSERVLLHVAAKLGVDIYAVLCCFCMFVSVFTGHIPVVAY